jgi:hypothetical protein
MGALRGLLWTAFFCLLLPLPVPKLQASRSFGNLYLSTEIAIYGPSLAAVWAGLLKLMRRNKPGGATSHGIVKSAPTPPTPRGPVLTRIGASSFWPTAPAASFGSRPGRQLKKASSVSPPQLRLTRTGAVP